MKLSEKISLIRETVYEAFVRADALAKDEKLIEMALVKDTLGEVYKRLGNSMDIAKRAERRR